MKKIIKNQTIKKLKGALVGAMALSLLTLGGISSPASGAGLADYMNGCITSMGAGLVGTAAANAAIQESDPNSSVTVSGYAISGVVSCVVGAAYVGLGGSSAQFESSHRIKMQNEELAYQLRRLSKERCLLSGSCRPGGRAIVVDGPTEIRKQGDKVFETTTSTIEAVE